MELALRAASLSLLTTVCKSGVGHYRIADRGSRGDPVLILDGTCDADDCCGHRSDHGSDHAGARNDHVLCRACVRNDHHCAGPDIGVRVRMPSWAPIKMPSTQRLRPLSSPFCCSFFLLLVSFPCRYLASYGLNRLGMRRPTESISRRSAQRERKGSTTSNTRTMPAIISRCRVS